MKTAQLLYFLLLLPTLLYGQQSISGRVYDAKTREAIPFATIKFGESGHGMLTGLDGKFEFVDPGNSSFILVSCIGYQPEKISISPGPLSVLLQPDARELGAYVVKPPYEKMRRILNAAIANKSRNNPDKYDWYRCNVYYKMIVDATLPDTIINDTSKDSREIKAFFEKQHLLMSETYSKRTWKRPQRLQEDVVASRFSGLKKSVFNTLVTDVIPFHSYNDYITLNGKDYHNPVSRGFEQYYKFNLSDEVIQGTDTVWLLSFRPKGNNANELAGTVYINSGGYAISQIIARANDTMLKLTARIEQQYERISVNDSERRWFPAHLNYIIDWQQKSQNEVIKFHMKGNSRIDSVNFTEDNDFRFDKSHTVRLQTHADELSDSAWLSLRPEPLAPKEAETYRVIDSMGMHFNADRYMRFLSKLPEGKVPIGPVDLDIKRILTANKYEGTRLGLGLQTNERLVKWLSVGGWFGYGFRDKEWKYGAFAEVYADRYREFVFRVSYDDDISEPGRVRLHRALDKTYLKYLLLNRVDQTKAYTVSVKKRLGYWNLELSGSKQHIKPKYAYAFTHHGSDYSTYSATEASLSFRYAYAERTAPFFGIYTRTGSRYPILYGKLITGSLEAGSNVQIPYTQAIAAIQWNKHINRLGFEHIILSGGKSWSSDALPLSKQFAGNGFRYDTKSNITLYSFGGLMTMYPYEYYSDQFVNLIFRHDFDWKLFKLETKKSSGSSAPNISLQYNMLYGTLTNPGAHKYVGFSVPERGYHEAGMLLNNIFRFRYFDIYYLTCNLGYFYHLTPTSFDSKKNGRFVFGFGVEL